MSIRSLPRMSFTLLIGFFVSAVYALGATHDQVEKARISTRQARHIAQQAYPGKIMKEELEREGGNLRYSFDMRRGKHWREVGVDATGKVLENTAEAENPKGLNCVLGPAMRQFASASEIPASLPICIVRVIRPHALL